jgi:hypothetical protein
VAENKYVELDNESGYHEIDDKTVQELAGNPRLVHFVGMMHPPLPGVSLFFTALEQRHFRPNTARNKEFRIILMTIQGMIWSMVSIPAKYMDKAMRVAEDCDTIIGPAPKMIVSRYGTVRFPVHGFNVYGISFLHGQYPGLFFPADLAAILDRESARIERILQMSNGVDVAYV